MESFPIAPAASKAMWLLPAILAIVLVPLIVVIVGTVSGARASRFEISDDGLRLTGDWYGRLIPAAQVRAGDARRVDLAHERGMVPRRRTWGTGLPGYQAGWFRLQNGEPALLYLTDRARAVYVPTTAGYGVLLSPADPDAFLASLRTTLGRPRR